MTGNGRHRTGIFSRFTPRHSRCIPRYENSRSDQKKLGKLYIIPGQTRKTYAPAQFFDQEYFPVVSLIVSDLNAGPRTKIKSLNKCEELEGTGQGWDGTHSGMGASVK